MNIIVTGGAGFIGSHLVDKLIDQDHEVLIIDNLITGKKENVNERAKLWQLDLVKFFDWPSYMPGKVDVIFHLAALSRIQPSFTQPVDTYTANCTGTIVALEIAKNIKQKWYMRGPVQLMLTFTLIRMLFSNMRVKIFVDFITKFMMFLSALPVSLMFMVLDN